MLDVYEIKGSTTSNLFGIKVALMSCIHMDFILREYEKDIFTSEEIFNEEQSLNTAGLLNINTPKVINVDPYGSVNGHLLLLMTKIDGHVDLDITNNHSFLSSLAEALVKLHDNQITDDESRYERYQQPEAIIIPSWTNVPEVWGKLKRIAHLPAPGSEEAFIHRDFHPANVLWEDDCISGVVDWVNACTGPKSVDIGHCRWNLAMLEGVEAADEFLDEYINAAPKNFIHHIYWDIVSLMDVLEDPLVAYPGWKTFNRDDITEEIMISRMDDYAEYLLKEYGSNKKRHLL